MTYTHKDSHGDEVTIDSNNVAPSIWIETTKETFFESRETAELFVAQMQRMIEEVWPDGK